MLKKILLFIFGIACTLFGFSIFILKKNNHFMISFTGVILIIAGMTIMWRAVTMKIEPTERKPNPDLLDDQFFEL